MENDLFQALKTTLVTGHNTSRMLAPNGWHVDSAFLSCELSVLCVLVVTLSMHVCITYGLVDDAEGSGVEVQDDEEGALVAAEPKDKEAKKRKVADSESLQPNVGLSQGAVVERKVTDGTYITLYLLYLLCESVMLRSEGLI